MSTVIIGMDPHKRSATIEVMDSDESVLGRVGFRPLAGRWVCLCVVSWLSQRR